uniref:Uncharacterized protein n=1 Tax=Rhizophora mucronata TaxID=61149 RepID=A0A2P2NEH3_RHIMU
MAAKVSMIHSLPSRMRFCNLFLARNCIGLCGGG